METATKDTVSLRHELEGGAFTERRAADTAAAILEALANLQAHGLLHGALNPESISITPIGEIKLPRALANLHDGPPLSPRNVSYLSPEQAMGGEGDVRSDVFGVGTMLYEMLAQRRPFSGSSVETAAYAVANFEPARELSISAPMWSVIAKALDKIPDNRFQSYQEFIDALDHAAPSAKQDDDNVQIAPLLQPATVSITTSASKQSGAPALTKPTIPPPRPLIIEEPPLAFPTVTKPPPQVVRVPLQAPYSTPPPVPEQGVPMGAKIFLGVICAIIFMVVVGNLAGNGQSSDQSSSSTYVEPPVVTKPVDNLPQKMSIVVRVHGGAQVSMPTQPGNFKRRIGDYRSDVFSVNRQGAQYVAGSLIDATPDPEQLSSYASAIAKMRGQSIDGSHPITYRGKNGVAVAYHGQFGRNEIKGRVQVFIHAGRVVFFQCQWPVGSEKIFNPDAYFSSIKFVTVKPKSTKGSRRV